MSIDVPLSALGRTLAERGFAAPVPPPDPLATAAVLDQIEAAVAPLRLPAEVRRLWETVEIPALAITRHPGLLTPEVALSTWQMHLDEPGWLVPRTLFPIAYSQWAHLLVELHGADEDDGGAIFHWSYGGDAFVLCFDGLEDLLDDTLHAVDDGRAQTRGRRIDISAVGEDPAWMAILRPAPRHPVLGAIDRIPWDIAGWPASWVERSDLLSDDLDPAGADLTIAEYLAIDQDEARRVRVHGTVAARAEAGLGVAVSIWDHTGELRVWCPTSAGALEPRADGTYEFLLLRSPAPVGSDGLRSDAPDGPGVAAVVARSVDRAHDAVALDVRVVAG